MISFKVSVQSMTRNCFTCSFVAQYTWISLTILLISCNLIPRMKTFFTACWHHSITSFENIILINSFTLSLIFFIINMTLYFAYSWRKMSYCFFYRACISAIFFFFVLIIEVLMMFVYIFNAFLTTFSIALWLFSWRIMVTYISFNLLNIIFGLFSITLVYISSYLRLRSVILAWIYLKDLRIIFSWLYYVVWIDSHAFWIIMIIFMNMICSILISMAFVSYIILCNFSRSCKTLIKYPSMSIRGFSLSRVDLMIIGRFSLLLISKITCAHLMT